MYNACYDKGKCRHAVASLWHRHVPSCGLAIGPRQGGEWGHAFSYLSPCKNRLGMSWNLSLLFWLVEVHQPYLKCYPHNQLQILLLFPGQINNKSVIYNWCTCFRIYVFVCVTVFVWKMKNWAWIQSIS